MILAPEDKFCMSIAGVDGTEKYRLECPASSGTFFVPEPEPEPVEPRVIGFSQRDPKWAAIHLGGSSLTMGGSGCAVTSATMVATLADPTMNPLKMVTYLNANNGFTSGGNLYWGKIAEGIPNMRFVNYVKWESVPANMDYVRTTLSYHAQAIQVDFKVETVPLDTHFVCALGFTADGKDIDIIDPWTNTRTTLLKAYALPGWTLARAIYALAEYRIG